MKTIQPNGKYTLLNIPENGITLAYMCLYIRYLTYLKMETLLLICVYIYAI